MSDMNPQKEADESTPQQGSKQKEKETPMFRASKNIAFFLLSLYGVSLIAVFVTAVFKSGEDSKSWLDLFKSGFLLLGGALTTIIGYYFGSRGVQEAQATATLAIREADKAKEQVKTERIKGEAVNEELRPTKEDFPLESPPGSM